MFVVRFECAARDYVRGTAVRAAAGAAMFTLGFWLSDDFAGFAWLAALVLGGVALSRGILVAQRQIWELAVSPQEVRWGWHGGSEERIPLPQIQRVVLDTRDPETGPVLFAELKNGSVVEIKCGSPAGAINPHDVLTALEKLGVLVVRRGKRS